MPDNEFFLPFKCGSDGTEWLAKLSPVGPRFGFVAFERPGQKVDNPPPNRREELQRRLDDLLNSTPPLPPPAQSDVVPRQAVTQLTYDQITDFGFSCPSCTNR